MTNPALTRAAIAKALRAVAERLEKNQTLPRIEQGLGYEVFIDTQGRLVIRVAKLY